MSIHDVAIAFVCRMYMHIACWQHKHRPGYMYVLHPTDVEVVPSPTNIHKVAIAVLL